MSTENNLISSNSGYVFQASHKAAVVLLTRMPASMLPEIVIKGLLTFMRYSVKRGAHGETITHMLAQYGNAKILELFLKNLPRQERLRVVNATNAEGESPLFYCRFPEARQCINLLVDAGADLLQTDSDQNNFLHYAAKHSCPRALEAFLERLSKDTSLSEEARKNVLNAPNEDGDTPLIVSVKTGSKKCLEHLLNAKADPFIFDQQGKFLYWLAINESHLSIAQILAKREPKLKGTFALIKLANAFGLEPEPLLAGKKVPFPGSTPYMEQNHVLATLKEVPIRKKILSHCNEEQYEELLQAFTLAAENFPFKKIVQKIRQGELVIVSVGWEVHALSLVFRDGYLVICNRGEGCDDEHGVDRTFFAHKISLGQVTEKFLEQCFATNNAPVEEASKFYYGELLQELHAKQDTFCKTIQTISPKPIDADICSFAAAKAALRAALVLLTKDPKMARDASKAWATKQREWALDLFRKTPSPFDRVFLEEVGAAQAKRLEQRKKTLLVKHLFRLKEEIVKKQRLVNTLQDFGNYCGVRQRKKLEVCLEAICRKKKKKMTSTLFGRRMFLCRKFSVTLKLEAIDLFIKQIDPDQAIRKKINGTHSLSS